MLFRFGYVVTASRAPAIFFRRSDRHPGLFLGGCQAPHRGRVTGAPA